MSESGNGHDSRGRAGSGSNPSGSNPGGEHIDVEGAPAPGEIIAGKYTVDGVLGVGGMGVVVAARHNQLGQRVAIKFMRLTAADPASIERFFREARAVVALSSEHVAKVLDMGTLETGAPYIVMEFLAGLDLGETLRRHGPMPVGLALESVLQACEAIAEAHSVGIVHRDLKPSNLFACNQRDGTPFVKVLDFGISKMAPAAGLAHHDLTASGAIMGSPGYMSPEQVRNSKNIDARSDIWSVGVILYELLAGVSPFSGDTLGEVFSKIVSEAPVPLRQLRPDVPPQVAAAIEKCLERDPLRRFAHLGELASMVLPFAPAEATVSVRRILRVCAAAGQLPASNETLAAPVPAGEKGSFDRVDTGPAWLRSNATTAATGRRSWGVLAIVALGVVLASGVTWLVMAQRGRGAAAANDPESRPAQAASAAPPPSAAPVTAALLPPPEEHEAVTPPPPVEPAPAATVHDAAPPLGTSHPVSAPAERPRPVRIIPPIATAHPATPAPAAPHPAPAATPHETDVF